MRIRTPKMREVSEAYLLYNCDEDKYPQDEGGVRGLPITVMRMSTPKMREVSEAYL
jgi:hypothetical protein